MGSNDVVINDLIQFELGDVELEKLLEFLYRNGSLIMNCLNCGLTIIPQARNYHSTTHQEEFNVDCVGCGRTMRVRMYGKYGFILPTDDEFYKGRPRSDGWEVGSA